MVRYGSDHTFEFMHQSGMVVKIFWNVQIHVMIEGGVHAGSSGLYVVVEQCEQRILKDGR